VTLCYLGELNSSTQARWLKTVEVFNAQGGREQLKLFPSDVEPPADDPHVARVLISKVRPELMRQFGTCSLGLQLWKRLELDRFWAKRWITTRRRRPGRGWQRSWRSTACAPPGSELAIAERWYPTTALDALLGIAEEQIKALKGAKLGVREHHVEERWHHRGIRSWRLGGAGDGGE
jgi:hypothetical protein